MIHPLEDQSLWSRLTHPSAEVPKLERRTASLLASLLVARFAIHMTLLMMGLVYVLTGREGSWVGIRINLLGIGVSIVMYLLSRSRRYKIAAVMLVIETIVLLFGAAVSGNPSYDFSLILVYLVVPIFIAGLLFSEFATIIVSAVCVVSILVVLPNLLTGADIDRVTKTATFVAVVSTFIVVFVRHHNLAEKDRQHDLEERERQYRLIAENSTDIIARTSVDGILLYVSPA